LEEITILETFKGVELKGKEYVPLFNYFSERREDGCFRV
jgi:isoleucyl-tRNA synthetase